jgi:probable phosphoglycerate mutase
MCTRIILVRHGQTEWNRVERFRGRANVPLNATGLAQADATGQKVAALWQPAAIYASPLVRALSTAEAITWHVAQRQGIHRIVQVCPGLIDIDYGQWQGLTPEEARQRWPQEVEAWYETPENARIPGGETLDDLRRRGLAAVEELAARHAEQTIVLVGHTVINRVILLAVLGLGNDRFWRLHQDTCAINVFDAEGGRAEQQIRYTIITLNDICHLQAVQAAT